MGCIEKNNFCIIYEKKHLENIEIIAKDINENKTEINITETNERKELLQNIEKYNKERMARYYKYNTGLSIIEPKNNNNLIILKLYNKSNLLVDEIEIDENWVNSKLKNIKLPFNKNKNISFGKNNSSDYIIEDNSISPIQFYINYNENKKQYYIMDNLSGTGTFVKLNKEIKIEQDMIISFCVDYMYFNIIILKNGINKINIKFLNKNKNSEKNSEISFDNKEYKSFTIGRSNQCNYIYDEDSVSKIQCTFIFENDNWYIYDGLYSPNEKKISTNGLWLLTKNNICLNNNMILKTGDMKIIVSEDN